jgi:hypothetical protein
VRTAADYQRRVPLRTYEAFWTEYWQPAFPVLDGVTWPGRIPYLALSSGTTSGATKFIPVSPEMILSNRTAALTALSWLVRARPGTRLFAGRMFFLGGSTALQLLHKTPSVLAGDLSGIAARTLAGIVQPYTFPPLDLALLADWDEKLARLAEQSVRLPITLVSGVPSWLTALFERVLHVRGKSCIADVWPMLRVVVHGGTKFDPYRAVFRKLVGSESVEYLETYPASEGFVAAEDPRAGSLRLIPDHGVFFEFVPVEELDADEPARHTVAEIEPGVQYAVVVTTCAGLWSYVLGDTVCFERREPPLLRFTGRTRHSLSAFGEHLICEEVEAALAHAAERTGALVSDFHVGPLVGDCAGPGRHRYLIEFIEPPASRATFSAELDQALCRANDDYRAHRAGSVVIAAPEVWAVHRGGFAQWMRSRGKLGGQHKVPRMEGDGKWTVELCRWLSETGYLAEDSTQRELPAET